MKVLIITIDYPPPYGGIATFTKNLEKELKKKKHIVEVLNFDSRNKNNLKLLVLNDFFYTRSTSNEFFALGKILNPTHILNTEGGLRHFIFSNMIYRIAKEKINTFKPDIIHLTHSRIYTTIFETVIPVVVTCHSEEINDTYPVNYVLKHAKMIHCVSNFTKKKVLSIIPSRISDVVTIPNSIDVKAYHHKSNKKFKLISICRLDTAKNIISVIKALSYLPSDILSEISYSVVGVGETYEEVKETVQKLNLESVVKFHSQVSEKEKIELLASASVFIMCPTIHKEKQEGFGIVYLEAQAASLPIIASKVGGIPEAVGSSGLFVENELNPHEISDKIKTIFNDKELYKRLSSNGKNNVVSYDHALWSERILELYHNSL